MIKKRENKKIDFKWGDFIIIGVVLVTALALWVNLILGFTSNNSTAQIVYKGQIMAIYDLESGQREYQIENITDYFEEFEEEFADIGTLIHVTSDGIHFDLLIKDGKIKFNESDCPDQVCVYTGDIYRNGEVSVCLPAGVIVRVVGEKEDSDQDIIIG